MSMVNAGEITQVAIIERWQWYFGALKDPSKIGSADLPIHANEYQLGYYRCRRKNSPWEPVGIYPDDDGVVVGMRNGEPVRDIQELFLWACRYPITHDAYIKALAGGGFDDEPEQVRGLGDNSGDADPLDAIAIELAGEIEQVRDFMRNPVENQAQADRLGIWAKRLTDLAKRADNQRVVEKEPHLTASKAVDDKWREPIAEAKEWAAAAKKRTAPIWFANEGKREMAAALTYDELVTLKPCRESFKRVAKLLGGKEGWNGNKIDAASARQAGCTFDDIIWAASALARKDADVERRLRLFMADCAARVLHIYEKTETSPAPRNAIIAARHSARGEIDAAALAAAWATALAAARDAAWDAARDAALATALAAARDAAWDAARDAARDAAWAAAWDAARDAALAAAWDAEQAWQFDRLVERLSDVEPEDWPLPTVPEAEAV